ncbi:hypothetical protein ACFWP5_16830 [Streptomyces sp. NPDC058469]|uniref:hypothetical protein n=1 Tax=Streptomyces sp. NPDC058469 TaxID=3346514 RepID=UPI003649B6A1
MGNRADDEGTDVEIYRRALTDTIHADTPTGAPEQLLALLDQLGFERNTLRPADDEGPTYIWHEAPGHLSQREQKRLATRAVPALLTAGYAVGIPDYLFDRAIYRRAVAATRAQRATPASPSPAATGRPRRSPG